MRDNILVTGGAGFIGSHLVDKLLNEGARVCVVDNFDDYYSRDLKLRNIQQQRLSSLYHLEEIDIRDSQQMDWVFREYRPRTVVHLAAKAGVRSSVERPHDYVDVNIGGTLNVLTCSHKYQVEHVVFASSSSVYGLNEKVPFSEEDSTLSPASPYAASKIAGEALCRSFSHCYEIPITALRFFTVYGPRQRPDLAVCKFVSKILQGHPIQLFGDGSTSRDYTYIDDIVSGILKTINYKHKGYEVFNLGNDTPVTLFDLVSTIENVVGYEADIEWLVMPIGDVPKTWADIGKSRKVLHYNATVTLSEGISSYYEWYLRREGIKV